MSLKILEYKSNYKAKHTLGKDARTNLYSAFIHSHVNYGGIAKENTNKSKLNKLASKEKEAMAFILNNKAMNTNDKYSKCL